MAKPKLLRRTTLVALVALVVLGAGCGQTSPDRAAARADLAAAAADEPPAATSVEATASEYGFELSATTVAAGRVPLALRNDGAEPHQLMVARLHDGVTLDDYLAAYEDSEGAAGELVDEAGGVNIVDPGTSRTGYADLEPGSYIVLCFLPAPDGASHLHHGMAAELTVVDAPVVDAPEPTAEIDLVDFGFALPDAGLGTGGAYRVVNQGEQSHELVLMRVDEGKTLGDVAGFLQGGFKGDPPVQFVGGAGGVDPGSDTYVDLDLEPGDYIAMCFLPDAATGKRHAELGMVTTFSVP